MVGGWAGYFVSITGSGYGWQRDDNDGLRDANYSLAPLVGMVGS